MITPNSANFVMQDPAVPMVQLPMKFRSRRTNTATAPRTNPDPYHVDILDVEGDTEIIGKPQGSDHVSDKATYPKLLGLKQAKETADRLIATAVASLGVLKENAEPLRILAEYVIKREK